MKASAENNGLDITPIVLTLNEEANLAATLGSLSWAQRIVVVDSGSTDRTQEIARSYTNVAWFSRTFDTHRDQWSYAIFCTQASTRYVLALDADMSVSDEFVAELSSFVSNGRYAGGITPFHYCIGSNELSGSIYPPQARIFQPRSVHVEQPGHTQVFRVAGELYKFRSKLIHRDQKPLSRWLDNQLRYAVLEAQRIRAAAHHLSLKDKLRSRGVAPILVGLYSYLRAGGPLNGGARAYAHERTIFEALLGRVLAD